MHSPGVCGVILTTVPGIGSAGTKKVVSQELSELIDVLNTDTDLVLVTAGADAEVLEPTVWSKAAYMVRIPGTGPEAATLRAVLQEVLNHGRDTVIVTTLHDAVTAETIHRMIAEYCTSGDEVWAVIPEAGYPVLLGRRIIELFLREHQWNKMSEILDANTKHVFILKSSHSAATTSSFDQQL